MSSEPSSIAAPSPGGPSPSSPGDPEVTVASRVREFITEFFYVGDPASLTNEGKILSLSVWRDEDAVQRWRQLEAHRAAQAKGRGGIFADYRLRVASVIRDYGMSERGEAPADSRAAHDSGKR